MRTLGLLVLLGLTLAGTAALAQSVDGVWEGEVQGRNGLQKATFTFKVDGGKLTGKVTTQRGDSEIMDGKVEGDQISFKTQVNFGGNSRTIVYTGKVSGAEIAFKRVIQDFDRSSEFTAKRKT
jgi:hypothetical protein